MSGDRPMSTGTKVLLLGIMSGVLMIGALIIWAMSWDRETRSDRVASQITDEWGTEVSIGRILLEADSGKSCHSPAVLDVDADVESMSLHRNIYEAEVFTADVSLRGSFSRDALPGDTLCFIMEITPVNRITEVSALTIAGREAALVPEPSMGRLVAHIDSAGLPATTDFSMRLSIHGSGALSVCQSGERSTVTIGGAAHNPSFDGSNLPTRRAMHRDNFTATWQSNSGTALTSGDYPVAVTHFLVGVDRFQKVSRSLKYSFLIIVLTFLSVLLTELALKHPIPLLNYFLIGAALILFYSLLLAFAEHLSFGASYLIAAVMTVLLIAGYMWKMLKSAKVGATIGSLLSLMYLSCYVLLSLSAYALLLGSLILFAALAAMMYATLHIERLRRG